MASSQGLGGYTALDRCVAGPGVSAEILKDTESMYSGCLCVGRCSIPHCSCNIAYNTDGQLLDTFLSDSSPPIFECNSNCTCDPLCVNRTTQSYSCHPVLATFETSNKGIGVCAKEFVSKGTYIGQYVGEILSSAEAMRRLAGLKPYECCYIVQYKEHMSSGNTLVTNVDAMYKGNLSRFINHSCSPNLMMIPVRSGSLLPRLCLYACRDVSEGEELCFSYFGKPGATISGQVDTGTKKCFCGSKECVGYLPLQQ